MTSPLPRPTTRSTPDRSPDEAILSALRAGLPGVAEQTIAAVIAEVPAYADVLNAPFRRTIEQAVQTALGGFLRLAERGGRSDAGTPQQPALDAAYALGRGEARSGRSVDALLAAYRVGARVAWRGMSATAVEGGVPAGVLAQFAELVFAYIDELSAASVAGHTDELANTGRVRQRSLERLALDLLAGAPAAVLAARAERAGWDPPVSLTAVVVPAARVRGVVPLLDPRTLELSDDQAGLETPERSSVLLVPGADGARRAQLLGVLRASRAVAGPDRPWTEVASSFARAAGALRLVPRPGEEAVDTEEHLVALVLGADGDALRDLRARALEPLSTLRPATASRLEETLRQWLLHQGRRDDVARALIVHPQTVRYRMTQLRALFGDRLDDPRSVLDLMVALAAGTSSADVARDAPGRPANPVDP